MLAIIENVRPHGGTVKTAIAEGLRVAGYLVAAFGKGAAYVDNVIPYEHSPSRMLDVDLTNYQTICYGGLNLWETCRGSIGYRWTRAIGGIGEEEIADVKAVYSEAATFYDAARALLIEQTPSLVVVWGGMFYEGQILTKLAAEFDIPCYATEFSFDPARCFFDEAGVIANRHSFARAWEFLRNVPLTERQRRWVHEWTARNYRGKAKTQPERGIPESARGAILTTDRPNILLLGQCYVDTVTTMDSPLFRSTMHAYEATVEASRELDINLILKLHPGDRPPIKQRVWDSFDQEPNVHVVGFDQDINVYSLMDACDAGITINSQAGLEMLAKHKNVLTLGRAFYGGKGFNLDLPACEVLLPSLQALLDRPSLTDQEAELADRFLYHFLRSYLVEIDQAAELVPRVLRAKNPFSRFVDAARSGTGEVRAAAAAPARKRKAPLRLLITHPSPRWGGSGYYLQEIAHYLHSMDAEILVLAEGTCPPSDQGIEWRRLAFEGPFLATNLKRQIRELDPNLIWQVGVRTKPMRAALEALVMTNARFVVQAEDDEFIPYAHRHPAPHPALLELLDRPHVTEEDVARFGSLVDWGFLYRIAVDPDSYRWVEPTMRAACYQLADLHTAIWHPMAKRLEDRFGKRTFVVPPVVTMSDFDPAPLSQNQRDQILSRYKIPADSTVFFVGGTIYDFSDEYETFLDALALAQRLEGRRVALVVSGRSRKAIHEVAKQKLRGSVTYRSLGVPDDAAYVEMLKASDVVCAPGYPDDFNRYRLPSRLIKAMALNKPVLTFECGFGESLEHGENAFLTSGTSAEQWARVALEAMDPIKAEYVGRRGGEFARRHFDAAQLAAELHSVFVDVAHSSPPREARRAMPRAIPPALPPHTGDLQGDRNGRPLFAPDFWTETTARRKVRKLLRDPVRFVRDMRLVRRVTGAN